MKLKILSLIVCIFLILSPFMVKADAADYDLDALLEYVTLWEQYFESLNYPYYVCVDYFNDNTPFIEIDYLINSEFSISLQYNVSIFLAPESKTIALIIQGEMIDTPLENVRFILDNKVISADYVSKDWANEDPYWMFELGFDTWSEIWNYNDITVLFDTKKGIRNFLLFTSQEDLAVTQLVDYMVYRIVGCYRYSFKESGNYLNPDELPIKEHESADDSSADSNNFINNYKDIEAAAQSMFLVKVYNNHDELIASGSGFVAFDEHYFITNHHIIENAAYLVVYDDNNNCPGYVLTELVSADKEKDIAILSFDQGKQYRSLPFDTSSNLMRGQPVIVIGSPKGIKNTVSNGIISALIDYNEMQEIQFTASISPGSSGGALFNDNGKVIGLVFSKRIDAENMNYAIPIKEVVDLKGKTNSNLISLMAYNYPGNDQAQIENKYLSIQVKNIISKNTFTLQIENLKEETIIEYELYIASKDPSTFSYNEDISLYCSTKAYHLRIGAHKSTTCLLNVDNNPVFVGIKQVTLSDGTVIPYRFDTISFIKVTLANPTSTPKPTATPKPTTRVTAKPTKQVFLTFSDKQDECYYSETLQLSLRVLLKNIAEYSTVVEYTLCYGTKDLSTLAGYIDSNTKTKSFTQTYAPGTQKYSGYITINIKGSTRIYVGIKEVKLSNGKTITYDWNEMPCHMWYIKTK